MMMPRTQGLIIFEGCDAVGKATQSLRLKERFERSGATTELYSFPRYKTEVGKTILRHLLGEVALVCEPDGTRASEDALIFQGLQLMDKMDAACDIENHLGLGRVVICDRWWQSAYAFGAADGLDEDWLVRIHSTLPQPWFNIFIDVPPEEALKRRPEARDRYERDREKQKVVRANYEKLWTNAGVDYVKIDGLGTQDEVHERIWQALEARA